MQINSQNEDTSFVNSEQKDIDASAGVVDNNDNSSADQQPNEDTSFVNSEQKDIDASAGVVDNNDNSSADQQPNEDTSFVNSEQKDIDASAGEVDNNDNSSADQQPNGSTDLGSQQFVYNQQNLPDGQRDPILVTYDSSSSESHSYSYSAMFSPTVSEVSGFKDDIHLDALINQLGSTDEQSVEENDSDWSKVPNSVVSSNGKEMFSPTVSEISGFKDDINLDALINQLGSTDEQSVEENDSDWSKVPNSVVSSNGKESSQAVKLYAAIVTKLNETNNVETVRVKEEPLTDFSEEKPVERKEDTVAIKIEPLEIIDLCSDNDGDFKMVSVKKEPPDLVDLCYSDSDSDSDKCGDQGQSASATSADIDSDSEIVIRRKKGTTKKTDQSK